VLGVVTGLKSEAKLLKGSQLVCVSTGGQAREARRKIDRLIGEGATGLISFGIAGALSPELRTGDLIVADMVANDIGEVWQTHQPWLDALRAAIAPARNGRRPDAVPHHAAARRAEGHAGTAPLWTSDGDLPESAPTSARAPSVTSAVRPGPAEATPSRQGERSGVRVGAILGLDRMLSSPQEKADAFARRGALAIDMESHHVARAAGEQNLPFIAVRAISDQADDILPAIMATFVDAAGQTKMSAVLAALIFGRVRLGELLHAGGASRRAHQALLHCRGALAGLGSHKS
jgi:adenosylhomocysteine nucleosidase